MKKKNAPPWFKNRGYLHFDPPLSSRQAESFVLSMKNIEKHSFYPFLHYEIPKLKIKIINNKIIRNKKKRSIAYAAHRDSHIFAYYTHLLELEYEKIISIKYPYLHDSILAFRKLGKSNIDFAKCAFDHVRKLGDCSVLALDITGFFDNLDHDILKKAWCKILNQEKLPKDHYAVYKAITKFSQINRDDIFKYFGIAKNNATVKIRERICTAKEFREFKKLHPNRIIKNTSNVAIPQGSPISAFLSNIYMLDFDNKIFNFLKKINPEFMYLRYCDDILCIVNKDNITIVENFIFHEMNKLKLQINQQKTDIVHFSKTDKLRSNKALQYLGFILENDSISLRASGLTRYSNKMKRGVSLAKQTQRKFNVIRNRNGLDHKKLYKKKLYSRYSHFGKRNFISYAKRAKRAFQSETIRKQIAPLYQRLHNRMKL